VVAEVGVSNTGVHLSPHITCKDMADPEIVDTIREAADVLEEDNFRELLREHYANTIIVSGHDSYARATQILDAGHADLIAFDRPFVANPDLPRRLRLGLPLAEHQTSSLVGGGTAGYTDYPSLDVPPAPSVSTDARK
jgi:N-ethylmaleimide reductase